MNTALTQTRALLVARVLVSVYLLEILLNLVRPRLVDHEPTLTIFAKADDTNAPVRNLFNLPATLFWILVAGVVVGLVLQIVAVRFPAGSREARLLTWATLAVLLVPFGLLPLWFAGKAPLVVLACVPTTVLALIVLHLVQPFGRVPFRLLLFGLAWGALVANGFFRACSNLMLGTAGGVFLRGRLDNPGDLGAFNSANVRMLDTMLITGSLAVGVALGGGVLVLLLLVPPRLRDLTTGTVVGAATGLGFALSDSIVFIKLMPMVGIATGATTGFEFWIWQVLALFAGSLALGAVLGGALAVAVLQPERRQQFVIGVAGFAAVAGGWAASQKLSGWLQYLAYGGIDQGSAIDTLIVSPVTVLLFQAPFVVAYVLLLRIGYRERAERVRPALAATVDSVEARVLGDPVLRLRALVTTFRQLGRPATLALDRLQEAQLALAGSEPGSPEWESLREKALRLRSSLPYDPGTVRS